MNLTGTKLCVLINKLEITVWHCPGKMYIYIYRKIVHNIQLCRLALLAMMAPVLCHVFYQLAAYSWQDIVCRVLLGKLQNLKTMRCHEISCFEEREREREREWEYVLEFARFRAIIAILAASNSHSYNLVHALL